jgi:uncharacterized protein
MSGLSVKLPLREDYADGKYALNKNYSEVIRQNLKNLLLTEPGERIMDPNFGVGLKKMLFEQNTEATHANMSAIIHQQISKYMPFIQVDDVTYGDVENNSVTIQVIFTVPTIRQRDILILPLSNS